MVTVSHIDTIDAISISVEKLIGCFAMNETYFEKKIVYTADREWNTRILFER